MIRKLLLPALFAGLLGGCVTAGYSYRDGYYYGQPSVDYRYYDYGYPYGYYPGYSYGYPYYGYPYYRRPYYYYPNYYYRPNYHHRPGTPSDHDDNDHGNLPPWRDYDRRRRVDGPRNDTRVQSPAPAPRPEARNDNRGDGSRMRPVQQRSDSRRRPATQEP